MPTKTIEMPLDMFSAAETIAAENHVGIVGLFANLLHERYGVDFVVAPKWSRGKREVDIPAEVDAVSGLMEWPRGASEKDLISEAVSERHGGLA